MFMVEPSTKLDETRVNLAILLQAHLFIVSHTWLRFKARFHKRSDAFVGVYRLAVSLQVEKVRVGGAKHSGFVEVISIGLG